MAIGVTGCTAVSERKPDAYIELTDQYAHQTEGVEYSEGPWWGIYDSDELNSLIKEALANNPGINQTRSRLKQASALARREFSDLLPDLDISGKRETTNGDDAAPSDFTLIGVAGYELDIWGGHYADYKAGDLEASASAQDIQIAAITLSASIVQNWLQLLSLREEEAVLTKQVEINEMVLDLQLKRYSNGVAAALDVLQQKELLARATAQLPDVQAQQEILIHQLAVLSGRNPSFALSLSGNKLPKISPIPNAGIPAKLLQYRPDIVAAWLRLLSADWSTQAAWTERLPSFNISSSYTITGTAFDAIFDAWLLKLAANIAAPLIDGGQRKADELRARALADEKLHIYKETVLNAIAEVEDALSDNVHQKRKIKAIGDQLEASRNALEQAQINYAGGENSYLSVLNGLIGVQSLERQLVRERSNLALDRVALHRAVGLRSWNITKENDTGKDIKSE